MVSDPKHDFTLEPLSWQPWVNLIEPEMASSEQIDVMYELAPNGDLLPFYGALIHDPESLRSRMYLYKIIMYGKSELSRAERELVGTVVSRLNECVYCTSNHGRLFASLSKREELASRIIVEVVQPDLTPRESAIVNFAVKVTQDLANLNRNDIKALKQVGLTDLEIFDLSHVVAMFAWANRLAEGLGEISDPTDVTG